MDKYYVLVAGSGASSRANVEALIEDHIYANGQDVAFVIPFTNKISQGQLFLAQYAKDKGKDLIVFATPSADLSSVPSASYSPSEKPIEEAIEYVNGLNAFAFFLWDDEDLELVQAANKCSNVGLKVYDLTDGLNLITMTDEVTSEEPNIPEAEMVKPPLLEDDFDEDEEDYEEEDEEFEEDDEEELEDDILNIAYTLVEALTAAVTKKVLAELEASGETTPKKPSKGV